MGCCFGSSADYDQPSPETRRRQQAEAAEKRQKSLEGRGVKNPEELKRRQQRQEEMEKQHLTSNQHSGGGGLRWQVS